MTGVVVGGGETCCTGVETGVDTGVEGVVVVGCCGAGVGVGVGVGAGEGFGEVGVGVGGFDLGRGDEAIAAGARRVR